MNRRLVLHPFMLAVYPILTLYSSNVYEASPAEMIGPIVLALFLVAIIFGLASRSIGDVRKGGLIASILVVLFFFSLTRLVVFTNNSILYISSLWVPNYYKMSPLQVFTVESLVAIVAGYLVLRTSRDTVLVTKLLNVFTIALFIVPIVNILNARPPLAPNPTNWTAKPLSHLQQPESKPDIYYIILDSYARADVMKSLFDVDNQPFLERLEKKGFYIAKQATANYGQTRLCLSCSLNCRYLDEFVRDLNGDLTLTSAWIGQNDVVATLRTIGYKFVSFSTGFQETDHPDSDLHLAPSRLLFTGFQRLLLTTTPLGLLVPLPNSFDRFESIRERVLYKLDHLPDVADDPASTFTFAHFMSPHPPFLFGQNGEDIRNRDSVYYESESQQFDGRTRHKEAYWRGYRDQAIYITKRIEETIDRILAKSKTPPIIILQSDHGSGMNLDIDSVERTDMLERMTILNAYYFPDRRYERLYQSISPVNSFRVVLDTYFGTKLGLLPDKSVFSTWPQPFVFHDVSAAVIGKTYESSTQGAHPDPATVEEVTSASIP